MGVMSSFGKALGNMTRGPLGGAVYKNPLGATKALGSFGRGPMGGLKPMTKGQFGGMVPKSPFGNGNSFRNLSPMDNPLVRNHYMKNPIFFGG